MSRRVLRRSSHRWLPRVLCFEDRITPAVTWDGGGGNFEWFTAANWSTNVVPGILDDVEVSNTGNGLIYYNGGTTAIKSLKLDDSLLLDSGNLSISGVLTITSGRFLRTNGVGVDVTVLGATNIDEGNIQAYNNSTISLPGLTAINTKADVYLDARGGNSVIDVSNLASVATTAGTLHIWALDGGIVGLDNLTKIEDSSFDINATDPTSVIDAPLLNLLTTPVGQTSYVTAVLGGEINVGPMLKSLDRVRLSSDESGFPVEQLVSFKHESIYLNGGAPTFPILTTFDSGGLYASGGAIVTLPGITSMGANDSGDSYIDANGAGTSVTFANLLTVAKQDPYRIHFRAYDNGSLSIPLLTSLAAGNAELRATDGGTVNMPMLSNFSPPSGSFNYIASYGGGNVNIAPALKTLDRVQLELSGSGFPTAQLISFKHANLYVYGGSPSFANLTTLESAGISVQNDLTTVVLTGITTIPSSDIDDVYIDVAYGTASLSLPNLVTVAMQDPYRIHFRAYDGGTMSLAKLTSLAAGNSELSAYNDGKINAPLLAAFSPPSGSFSYLGAYAGGVVTIASGLTTLDRVQLEVEDAGFPTAQLTSLKHSRLYVYGGSPSFANVTTLETTGITAQYDANVVMSGITTIPASDSVDMYFDAAYGPANLSFPNLVSVAKQNPYRIHFRAFNDGTVSIPLLTSLAAGNADLTAYNDGKILAPLLASFTPPSGSYSIIAAFAGGSITVAPTLTTLDGVQLEVEGTGFPLAQLTSFKHAQLYVYGGMHTLNNLTEFASAGISVQNDAVVVMPGITTIPAAEVNDVFFDAGFGGTTLNPSLSLPNLVTVARQDPLRIHFRAFYGGTVSLGSLTSLAAGNAELSAYGTGTIDAPLLVNLSPPTGSSSNIYASDNSKIQVAAGLTQLDRTDLAVDSLSSFPVGQLTSFKHARMDISGGALAFVLLSELTDSSVFVSGTANVTMPAIVSMSAAGSFNGSYFQAAGDCELSFPNLTTLTGTTSGDILIRAYDSGEVSMPLVTQFNTGGIYIYAEDTDSVVDLSSLNALTIPATSFAYVTAVENGTIKTAANLSMLRVQFGFDDTAHFNFANLDLGLDSTMAGYGTLKANVINAGTIEPGYFYFPNTLTIDGKYTQTSTGHLKTELAGTTAGTGYDQLVITGQATLNGTVDVYLSFGFQPNLGNTFDVVTFASRLGNFTGYSGLDVGNNVELTPVHGTTNVQLNAVASSGAIVTKFQPNGLMTAPTYAGPINFIEVTFSEAIDFNSLEATDISVSGPGGPYALTGLNVVAPNVVQCYLDAMTLNGAYTVVLGPGILDVAGNMMNQNGVAPNGETPADQYSTSFTIAASDLVIDSFTGVPANANFGQSLNLSWTIRNDGVAATTGGWSDRIWLSTDAKVDFGDIFLGDKASPGIPMNVNDIYISNLTVQLPLVPPNSDGAYFILLQTDVYGQLGEANETNNVKANATTLANPPRVIQVTVNNGDAQRSRVNSLTVVFSENVIFSPNAGAAFSVTRTGPGGPTGAATLAAPVVDNSTFQTKVTLTFSNDSFFNSGSLIDGKYQLTINAANVTDGQLLDGNGDGIVGDSYTFNFLRLFGDANGDGAVTASDFNQFRLAYGGGPSIFDFNGDSATSASDFNAFRTRYGVTLSP